MVVVVLLVTLQCTYVEKRILVVKAGVSGTSYVDGQKPINNKELVLRTFSAAVRRAPSHSTSAAQKNARAPRRYDEIRLFTAALGLGHAHRTHAKQ